MRLFLTGANGMVGSALCSLGGPRGHEMIGHPFPGLDVADRAAVDGAVGAARPDLLLHVGAHTDVDGCERDPDLAYRVNAIGTRNCALAAAKRGIPILYVSTDYVFAGDKPTPYVEFDPVAPQSIYGRSKLAGEEYVRELSGGRFYIVRTQWIFGFHGKNFVDTMIAAASAGKPLRVVDDQIGCPTYATDFASALLTIVERDPGFGTFHCSSLGECSWFEFTGAILAAAGITPKTLEPMKSSELDRPAKRPLHSVLRNYALEQTIGDPMPHWKQALESYLMAKRDARA